jgi:hypothetical protein
LNLAPASLRTVHQRSEGKGSRLKPCGIKVGSRILSTGYRQDKTHDCDEAHYVFHYVHGSDLQQRSLIGRELFLVGVPECLEPVQSNIFLLRWSLAVSNNSPITQRANGRIELVRSGRSRNLSL